MRIDLRCVYLINYTSGYVARFENQEQPDAPQFSATARLPLSQLLEPLKRGRWSVKQICVYFNVHYLGCDQLFDNEHYSDNPQDYLPDPILRRDPAFQAAVYSAIAAAILFILNSLFRDFSQVASPLMLLAIFSKPPITLLLLCALAWLTVYGCWLVSIVCVFASLVVRSRRFPLAMIASIVDITIGVLLFR